MAPIIKPALALSLLAFVLSVASAKSISVSAKDTRVAAGATSFTVGIMLFEATLPEALSHLIIQVMHLHCIHGGAARPLMLFCHPQM